MPFSLGLNLNIKADILGYITYNKESRVFQEDQG